MRAALITLLLLGLAALLVLWPRTGPSDQGDFENNPPINEQAAAEDTEPVQSDVGVDRSDLTDLHTNRPRLPESHVGYAIGLSGQPLAGALVQTRDGSSCNADSQGCFTFEEPLALGSEIVISHPDALPSTFLRQADGEKYVLGNPVLMTWVVKFSPERTAAAGASITTWLAEPSSGAPVFWEGVTGDDGKASGPSVAKNTQLFYTVALGNRSASHSNALGKPGLRFAEGNASVEPGQMSFLNGLEYRSLSELDGAIAEQRIFLREPAEIHNQWRVQVLQAGGAPLAHARVRTYSTASSTEFLSDEHGWVEVEANSKCAIIVLDSEGLPVWRGRDVRFPSNPPDRHLISQGVVQGRLLTQSDESPVDYELIVQRGAFGSPTAEDRLFDWRYQAPYQRAWLTPEEDGSFELTISPDSQDSDSLLLRHKESQHMSIGARLRDWSGEAVARGMCRVRVQFDSDALDGSVVLATYLGKETGMNAIGMYESGEDWREAALDWRDSLPKGFVAGTVTGDSSEFWLPRGIYGFQLASPDSELGLPIGAWRLQAAERQITLPVVHAERIEGTLLINSAPAIGVQVMVESAREGDEEGVARCKTDSIGWFDLGPLPIQDDEWILWCGLRSGPDCWAPFGKAAFRRATADSRPFEWRVETGRVELTYDNEMMLGLSEITLKNLDSNEYAPTLTAQGLMSKGVLRLPTGEYRIEGIGRAHRLPPTDFEVVAGVNKPLYLPISAAGTISMSYSSFPSSLLMSGGEYSVTDLVLRAIPGPDVPPGASTIPNTRFSAGHHGASARWSLQTGHWTLELDITNWHGRRPLKGVIEVEITAGSRQNLNFDAVDGVLTQRR